MKNEERIREYGITYKADEDINDKYIAKKSKRNTGKYGKELRGHNPKRFVTIDDDSDRMIRKRARAEERREYYEKKVSDSALFRGLLQASKKKKYHYSTYMDKLLRPTDGSKPYYPKYVSCLIKSLEDPECHQTVVYAEVVGSRLANAIGVDTVFNIAYNVNEKEESDDEYYGYDYSVYDSILSVDYIPTGYTTMSFADMGIDIDETMTIEMIFNRVEFMLYEYYNKLGKFNQKEFDEFMHNFTKQFVFKSLILEDMDMYGRNFGVLIGKNGEIKLAPCFDMEMAFTMARKTSLFKQDVETTINYLNNKYPKALYEVIDGYHDIAESGELQDILDNTINIKPYLVEETKERIIAREKMIMNYYLYGSCEPQIKE
ncbi:MAG: hypothetical protein E7356_01125 [Clostridiales bacterium]|nr:hypothetical protein [Clostridiales bacterium]